MGKGWIPLVVLAVMVLALLGGGLWNLWGVGVHVEVRFVPPEELKMSVDALCAAGLQDGGFEITLRRRWTDVGTTLSRAKLVKFAELTDEDADRLFDTLVPWVKMIEEERRERLAQITLVIRMHLKHYSGTLEEYMDERMGALRADEAEKSEIEETIHRLDWANFPVRGPGVQYVPRLVPCEPENVPRRVIIRMKDPLGDSMDSWTLPHGAIELGEPKRREDKPETRNPKSE